MSFPLPLPLSGAPAGPGAVNRIRLVLGVIPANAELQAREETVGGVPLWRMLKGTALRFQQEIPFEEDLRAPLPIVSAGS